MVSVQQKNLASNRIKALRALPQRKKQPPGKREHDPA